MCGEGSEEGRCGNREGADQGPAIPLGKFSNWDRGEVKKNQVQAQTGMWLVGEVKDFSMRFPSDSAL